MSSKYLTIVKSQIESGKCIILLGPDIAREKENSATTLQEGLYGFFEDELSLELEKDLDDFAVIEDNETKLLVYPKTKEYYQKHNEPDSLHKLLAEIPFHLAISTSPDQKLEKTFDKEGFDYKSAHFSKKRNPAEVATPTSEKPLLYNLFGTYKDVDSLVITHDDLFEFIFAIIRNNQLPRELLKQIKEAKVFLFLGFNLNHWYLKLIFRLFDLHLEPLAICSDPRDLFDDRLRSFYVHNFDLKFLDKDFQDPLKVIEKLNAMFGEEEKRKPKTERQNPEYETAYRIITKKVSEGKIEDSIEYTLSFLETKENDLWEETIVISQRYNEWKSQEIKGVSSKDVLTTERNKIADSLIELARKIRNLS